MPAWHSASGRQPAARMGIACAAIALSCMLSSCTASVVGHGHTPGISEQVFADFNQSTPGCAAALQPGQEPVKYRAAGSADLEHQIPITIDTVFEAGSVSKQFTAAAILLLVQDGVIALDTDVRTIFPELPDYGTTITVEMLLNHTSGLRDWGDIQDAAGWPRGERIFNLQDVLHIAAAQRELNYTPGTRWSYTNTGYNLAALLVERITGSTLADFSQQRIFMPLGMTRTRWRDNFKTVVPGRAIAYSRSSSAFEQEMPFESAYGNGGLLTTVGDLLAWNRALTEGLLGRMVSDTMERPTKLTDGRNVPYGLGLGLYSYGDLQELSHPGATAGYTAWLGRYPAQQLSIAVLCNIAQFDPQQAGRTMAEAYLPIQFSARTLSADEMAPLESFAGWYAAEGSGAPLQLVRDRNGIRVAQGPYVTRSAHGGLMLGSRRVVFLSNGQVELRGVGDRVIYLPQPAFAPDDKLLNALQGRFHSSESGASYDIRLEDGELILRIDQRPGVQHTLQPAYAGAFTFGYSLLRYEADASGEIDRLIISSPRMWALPMLRLP